MNVRFFLNNTFYIILPLPSILFQKFPSKQAPSSEIGGKYNLKQTILGYIFIQNFHVFIKQKARGYSVTTFLTIY